MIASPMIDNRAEPGEYHIAFDTQGSAGFLRSVKIRIECDMLPDDGRMPEEQQEKYAINLADHPLYKDLERYVLANPSVKYNFEQKSLTDARAICSIFGTHASQSNVLHRVQRLVKSSMIWAKSHN